MSEEGPEVGDVNGVEGEAVVVRRSSKDSAPPTAPKPNRRSMAGSVSEMSPPPHQPPAQHLGKLSAEQMDEQRKQNIAYEYLCHLEESKIWIQACINEELPPTTELEEALRNGVYLAKLAHFMAPNKVPLRKIYDKDLMRFQARGLHFRHTDNLNQWFKAMEEVGLPKIFYPETTDIYDRKNMPRTIYCLHALSLYLFKLGMAPQIEDLYGKVNFTEEEISAMRQELDKYGIQMPTFSKIGGILANELSQDDAALHAAIIAINEAVETQVTADILTALGNPAANIVGVGPDLGDSYTQTLFQAKQTKAENSKNKKTAEDESKEFDVYDEMLTQAELQGNINKVNTTHTLSCLNDVLSKGDNDSILKLLKSNHLGIKNVKEENIDFYVARLQEALQAKKNNNGEDVSLDKDDIQQAVNTANLDADTEHQKMLAVQSVNQAIETADTQLLMSTLKHPRSQLPEVFDFAAALYMAEFKDMRDENEGDLDYNEIYAALKVLSAIAAINQGIDTGNPEGTLKALSADNACIPDLDEENADRYQKALQEAKAAKQGESCDLLTHHEISEVIEKVNTHVMEEHQRILAINKINECIEHGKPEETLQMLKLPEAKLENVDDKQAYYYQVLLVRRKKQKAESLGDDSAELWVDEIQSAIDKANMDAKEGIDLSMGIAAINDAVDADNVEGLTTSLRLPDVGIQNAVVDCGHTYLEELQKLKAQKKEGEVEVGSGWMMNRTRDGAKFFFNTHTMEYLWCRNDDVIKDHSLLTKDEIQGVITEVTDAHNRELLFEASEDSIIKGQAYVRGYLTRKRHRQRQSYLHEQEPSVVKIQAFWKGLRQKRAYKARMDFLSDNLDATLKLQSLIRMWLVRSRYRDRLKYFKEHEPEIVKIQAFVRSNKAKHDYRALMYEENPPVSVVQRFVHLLDTSDADYAEELELQRVRQQVVKEIKSNQQLEHDLDQMDVKIGLLIKNRITLQDVVMHNKKLTKQRETAGGGGGNRRSAMLPKGLKALSKESHDRMEAYQHLFYLMQTNPTYLAKLIFEMPQDRTTKFMESVIYSLFNYGSNVREEYLLAKLFKTALEEEINSKVEKITDIVTGNPLVVKMIVGFNRNQRGQNALKEMLQPLVMEVVGDKNIKINTNPIEVYKVWVNQQESETGKKSELPYDVSTEQALKHEEVQKKLQESTDQLQALTDRFLTTILQSLDKIPYGIRYMAKVLRAALENKFPDAQEKDILKIVGNLLYYRYINPAIVAPDVFDIINVSVEKALTTDQRRNLGSVAKILQFAAANKGFGGDSSYLGHMNAYIKDAHEKFKKYCLAACDVEEPEVKFNIDQYTDVTMITKPVIYISVQEIVDTHQLLLEHQSRVAPDNSDPLHDLLDDLGDVPFGHELLGVEIGDNESLEEQIHVQLAKTEITLTLTNKFEVPEDDQTDIKTLLIRTKRMVVDVIACQQGDSLAKILETQATDEQEELHQALVKKRDMRDKRAARSDGNIVRAQSMAGDCRLPLHLMKTKIKKSLQNLELANVVTRKDGYQEIINLIAKDIRNQRRYRNNRKQELCKLRMTFKSLEEKRKFYEAQVDYYNQYVKTCIDNLQQKGRSHKAKANKAAKKAQGSIKYSGAKLHEKGVILEIEGLSQNQFKNAHFEIAATADPGVFKVSAKFMGIDVEKVELIFQDLLQLQYEGVAVMEMFGKTKINVNLLIFLINKKFYSNTKN